MAAALGYHTTDNSAGHACAVTSNRAGQDTVALITVVEQLKQFYAGEPVVITWYGLERALELGHA